MEPKALRALQSVIYHRLMMWNAGSEAEEILGHDVPTVGDGIDGLAATIDSPWAAYRLSEEDIRAAFELDKEGKK